MPTNKEFTINLEDRPGTLGKICRALADKDVNILAFQAFPTAGNSQVRMVVDEPENAIPVLDAERLTYKQTEVAHVTLPHRPGELARAASKLGESNINIDYAYAGTDASNAPMLVFGVADARRAAAILDQAVSKAA